MRTGTRTLAAAFFAIGLAACSGGDEAPGGAEESAAPEASSPEEAAEPAPPPVPDEEVAVITVEGLGEIVIELYPGRAPKTVANFKKLAREDFYDGTTFHRVLPGFMIQGGDPNSKNRDPRDDGRGGPGYTIPAEFNDIPHQRGVVSMARKSAPDTAGSQFFIVMDDSPHLDGKYTAFGRVVSGMEVADQIVAAPRDQYGRHGPRNRPLEDIVMTVRIEPAHEAEASAPAGPERREGARRADAGS